MPRRALVLTTALVLALHWLVLQGMPWALEAPQPSASRQVFSTRSVALAPPAPAVVPAAAPAPPARKPQVPRKPRPAPPKAPSPPAQSNGLPESAPADVPQSPPVETAGTGTADAAPETDAAPESPAAAAPQEGASAALPAEPPVQVASAPAEPAPEATAAGIEIAPPGANAGAGPASSAAALPSVRLPAPTRLEFDVNGQARKFNYSASAELLWQHDGSRYEARQEVSAFLMGSRAQRSVGAVTAHGLQPERFSDKSRSERAAHFDHAKGRVTFSANTPAAAVGPGAQDRLSVFIQLGALLAADPGRFVPGTQITLTTVSVRSADRWTFTVEGPETLNLPAGPTQTLKLQRLPRKDYDQKAELWVAPALNYLPVRIQLTQANGDFADLRLRSSSVP